MKYLNTYLFNKNTLRLIGVGIFGLIIWKINLAQVIQAVKKANIPLLILGFAMTILVILARSLRWNYLKRILDIEISPLKSCLYQVIAQVAFLTPGKVGEILKAFYVKKDGYDLSPSFVTVVGDRLFDLGTVVLIASVSLWLFIVPPDSVALTLYVTGGVGLIGCIVGIVYFRQILMVVGKKALLKLTPESFQNQMASLIESFQRFVEGLSSVKLIVAIVISIIAYLFQVLRIHVLCYAIGISISFIPLAGIISLMVVTNLLPISFSGLGTRDALFIYFFGLYGVTAELAVTLSFILLFSIFLNASLGALLFTIDPPAFSLDQLK